MELLSNSALTALFVGLVWALIKVVEFFISKYKNNKEDKPDILSKISNDLNILTESTKSQHKMIEEILRYSEHLDHMHSVYNEDHAPAWYIPSDMITLVRDNNVLSKSLAKDIDEHMNEIKDEQDVIVNKIVDLITSQKVVTERISDLILVLNKFSR